MIISSNFSSFVLPLFSTCPFRCFCLLCFLICRCLGGTCGSYSVVALALMNTETERRLNLFLSQCRRLLYTLLLPTYLCRNTIWALRRKPGFFRCAAYRGCTALLKGSVVLTTGTYRVINSRLCEKGYCVVCIKLTHHFLLQLRPQEEEWAAEMQWGALQYKHNDFLKITRRNTFTSTFNNNNQHWKYLTSQALIPLLRNLPLLW